MGESYSSVLRVVGRAVRRDFPRCRAAYSELSPSLGANPCSNPIAGGGSQVETSCSAARSLRISGGGQGGGRMSAQ